MDNIKPCPCCGSSARLMTIKSDIYQTEESFIYCENVACGIRTEKAYYEKDDADNVKSAILKELVTRWNRRRII